MFRILTLILISLASLTAFDQNIDVGALSKSKKPGKPQPPPPPPPPPKKEAAFVFGGYHGGRLGNQLFQVSAALSLALDHNATAVFPDYADWKQYDIPENLRQILYRINTLKPPVNVSTTYYEDPNFIYAPIPYTRNMKIYGFFQSEKYFKHNKDKILPLFEPRTDALTYLKTKYAVLLNHPCTVAMHLRAYSVEDPSILNAMVPVKLDYFEKAASLFDDNALFVVFTDSVAWAQSILNEFDRPYLIIENETHYHDFYLYSLLKHQIISNSTFSWWGAYLNKNPNKIVVAPLPWFQTNWHNKYGNENIIPEGWFIINPITLEVTPPK